MTALDPTTTMAQAYAGHAVELTRFATGLVGPSDAADVVSDALARLMASPVWAEARNHRAVLYRAVLWEARMHHRSRGRRLAREHRAAGRAEEAYEMADISPEVAATVAALSPQQRAVIFLTYWEDLDVRAVAELLDVSEGTVRRQLARARKRLREVLR